MSDVVLDQRLNRHLRPNGCLPNKHTNHTQASIMMLSSRSSLAARALLRPSATVLRRAVHDGTNMNKVAYRLVLIRQAFRRGWTRVTCPGPVDQIDRLPLHTTTTTTNNDDDAATASRSGTRRTALRAGTTCSSPRRVSQHGPAPPDMPRHVMRIVCKGHHS